MCCRLPFSNFFCRKPSFQIYRCLSGTRFSQRLIKYRMNSRHKNNTFCAQIFCAVVGQKQASLRFYSKCVVKCTKTCTQSSFMHMRLSIPLKWFRALSQLNFVLVTLQLFSHFENVFGASISSQRKMPSSACDNFHSKTNLYDALVLRTWIATLVAILKDISWGLEILYMIRW